MFHQAYPMMFQPTAFIKFPQHPTIEENGCSLEVITFLIVRTLFPKYCDKVPDEKSLEAIRVAAWKRLMEHHRRQKLFLMPSYMALYYILAVFAEQSFDDTILGAPDATNLAVEITVKVFSVFYFIASKWHEDPHPEHITHVRFDFGDKSLMDRLQWHRRYILSMERLLLPILDYNISVMPAQWSTFLFFLGALVDEKLPQYRAPYAVAVKILRGSYEAIGTPVPSVPPEKSLGQLRRDVTKSRKIVKQEIPALIAAVCDGLQNPTGSFKFHLSMWL
ncbi:hypothetical protein CC1G_14577 [Coprinopsis cinerea okayama7|uniref:Uncharacterized protein n=1 Tax=Coprinopsis cinerea (strain Okayama-7 / 130 / ATCC MYA-4618 / FGSC 9003) TaxID=240176 RepID=D6RMP9_COPC7|nr:hypothetical protein CC1G_14577 [Coprinopsis cinerea okayama7\|eukprot:XP_002911145.1 hypothetical protein CC1G_14577 [Coprinopsis cinerea okayama7\